MVATMEMRHSEQMIEDQFIQILSEKEDQWTYRPDLKSEESLWQNFRGHLNRMNLAVLEEQQRLALQDKRLLEKYKEEKWWHLWRNI